MPDSTTRVANLKNIGAVSAGWLNAIGIYTLTDLEERGVTDAYCQIRGQGRNVSLNLLYALQGALLDIHWTDVPEELKEELRRAVQR